jgi:hypothetical protein
VANATIAQAGFHGYREARTTEIVWIGLNQVPEYTYTFENFFHPFVSELTQKVNRESIPGVTDPTFQTGLATEFFTDFYTEHTSKTVKIVQFPKDIDERDGGPYANYNWELFYHIPLMIAVHLSKNQRFAEAQRWFHYIFDPTNNDLTVPTPQRFWRFLRFRQGIDLTPIDEVLALLSKPDNECSPTELEAKTLALSGYAAIKAAPFRPHRVARTRPLAYQYVVVMKYLDNLIAWGDSLFRQDTIESINEATQRYVLASNLLGPRPQRIPPRGTIRPKTFAQLKAQKLDAMGNAIVELEGSLPFNFAFPPQPSSDDDAQSGPLFGIGHTLYFCIPRNDKMLGYWDTVADRLFKIRHCMNIEGIVRPLAPFDPPIDPGMLVKAVAAGLDIGSIVSGLSKPVGPVRCATLIQKTLELCNEVRTLGAGLLAALEKRDAEHLNLMRQGHEIKIQQLSQEVRFLHWKAAQETTTSLLTTRAGIIERLRYYQRWLALPVDPNAPDTITLDRRELTEENFDEAYASLVTQYDKPIGLQKLADLKLAGDSSPSQQSGATSSGQLYLNLKEDAELNSHLPRARDSRLVANVANTISSALTFIPEFNINLHFWGMGASSKVAGGSKLSDAAKIAAEIAQTIAGWETDQAGMAGKTASYERRTDEMMLQYNTAAQDLMQNGRQILTSLVAEQIAHHEYLVVLQQIANSQEIDDYLHAKFTNEDLYLWMIGETSRLFYEYYRFAFDTARSAERTMKQEVMRPELDGQDFVKFNYWDGGRKGLLAGEALHLDVKRMELAYLEQNKRELEITRHVSLRQLNPTALLALKTTGSCTVTIPEWLYDRDCPGLYLRRIKHLAVSIPAVVGPYTTVNCTVSLLNSSIRRAPEMKDGEYGRQGVDDDRFVDYAGPVQSIVTSSANSDSGLFETNLRDERFLPFEGAGAVSTWKLDLPSTYPGFDYMTIADVIFHVRYTARLGVDPTKVKKWLDDVFAEAATSNLAVMFSLRYEFSTEWAAFTTGDTDFSATIRTDHFPYVAQTKPVTIVGYELYAADGLKPLKHHVLHGQPEWDQATSDLASQHQFTVTASPDGPGPTQVLTRTTSADVFLVVRYTLG